MSTYFLTTPIYYVNARPHIGHAYTTIVADVLARHHRLQGDKVWFLTGTDEHGQKIERSAQAANVPPQEFADRVSAEFRTLWDRMGLTYDQYIRTTDAPHKLGVQRLFTALQQNGAIYKGTYTGQYCVSDEAYVDGPVGIPCPDCGRITETVSESNYYFRLSQFQLPLLDLIESGTLDIQPEARRNEVLSFLRGNITPGSETETARSAAGTAYLPGALRDLSISRSSFKWGIPVPGDEEHVIYVWLDALANYMTAVGYKSELAEDRQKFEDFWPANLHIVGKEIIRFHCVYWPAFLLALNTALRPETVSTEPEAKLVTVEPAVHKSWAAKMLPKQVVAHGWLLFEQSKMSKSKGNIVRTETILDILGPLCPSPDGLPTKANQDLFASDILRYFLLREIPFGQDGSFSFDALITRYNADLVNGYGNLVSRTLTMINTNCDGKIPRRADRVDKRFGIMLKKSYETDSAFYPSLISSTYLVTDLELARVATVASLFFGRQLKNYCFSMGMNFSDLLAAIREMRDVQEGDYGALDYAALLIASTDAYLSEHQPWKLAKATDAESKNLLHDILYNAAESIRIITLLLHPIIPFATTAVWAQLGLDHTKNPELHSLTWGKLRSGGPIGPLSNIFPRADKGLAQIMTDIESTKSLPTTEPIALEHTSTEPAPTDPAAGPRTATLAEPNPGSSVAGSHAQTTERPGTPPHQEAHPSGIFTAAAPVPTGPADALPQISIDDFAKVELRVAKVLVCERIPKADKLLRLEVDLGYEQRQILSGIAEWYTPEELIGRRIVVITNLAPRKMRGLESHGMLLAGSSEGGKPSLATFLDTDILPLGSRLK